MKKYIPIIAIILLTQAVYGQTYHFARTGIHLTLPGAGWGLDFPAEDFLVEDSKIAPDGNSVSCRAGGNDIIMLCYFEKSPVEGDAAACRDFYMEKSKEAPMKTSGLRSYENGEMAAFEYLVTEFKGQPVSQMNIHAYLARNGYCAEVHLSRSDYSTDAYEDMIKVLNEVQASNGIDPAVSLQFDFGMLYYSKQDYDSAIVEYEKVLGREKELKMYNKYFWFIAYDHLAMSYGLSGNPDKAIEICERGLKQDKKYPMFYYTMACAYAMKGNTNEALHNLKKAYKYKNNTLPMETLPNPLEDESFKEAMKHEEFRKAVKKLVE